ncbi:hypothetical protein [Chitinophaga parva]|uniref:hypothetical protein n=1 Tax=Chitinophaga parva TaxID=2169414 RepID=UPI00105729DC|nr:hypothetical protein [Chitinophaga parva]
MPGSDEKNVELVAWLIDFDQRPFEFGKQYGELDAANADVEEGEKAAVKGETEQLGRNEAVVEKATGQEAGEEAEMEDETEREGKKDAGPGDGAEREGKKEAGPENKTAQAVVDAQETKSGDVGRQAPGGTEAQPSESAAAPRLFLLSGGKAQRMPWLKRRQLIMFILCLATMLAGAGVYLAFKFKWGMPPEGCMYWAGDHYERISCNEKKANTLIIAYDAEHLAHFRKITTPDTITYKAVGRVWYIKLNGNLEYFTADGYHPVEIHRKLHPITEYIIRTYLHPAADSTLISGGNGVTN